MESLCSVVGAVEHDGMILYHLFQSVPHLVVGAFHTLFSRFQVGALLGFYQPVHDEGLEQLQRHFLGDTALVKLELRSDDYDGTSGIVHALAQQVLTETSLLAAKQTGKGL